MGKSKKRIFNKLNNVMPNVLKRNEIIDKIISDVKTLSIKEDTTKYVSLFGIKAEELLEAGLSLEELSALNKYISL